MQVAADTGYSVKILIYITIKLCTFRWSVEKLLYGQQVLSNFFSLISREEILYTENVLK